MLLIYALEECHEEIVSNDRSVDPDIPDPTVILEDGGNVMYFEQLTPLHTLFKWSALYDVFLDVAEFWKAVRYTTSQFTILGPGNVVAGRGQYGRSSPRSAAGQNAIDIATER